MMDTKRNHGLDIVRSMAIIMVLISHITFLLPKSMVTKYHLWKLEIFGYYGVEVFFVLSGFLIGRILLPLFTEARDNQATGALLLNFYLRRWYRTLPLYYLILLGNTLYWAYVILPNFPAIHHPDWRHLVFLQNYGWPAAGFFPESWSLAVEEWFYLLFPLFLLGMNKMVTPDRDKRRLGYCLVGFIVFIFCVRSGYVAHYQPEFDMGIRKNVFLRLDSLGIGIFIAYLALYYPQFHCKLAHRKIQILGYLSLFGIAFYFWQVGWSGWDKSYFARTMMVDLVSIAFGLIMIGSYYYRSRKGKIFTLISKISYALYLVHLPIFATMGYLFQEYVVNVFASIGLILASSFLACYLAYWLYHHFEQPILALRPRTSVVINKLPIKKVK